MGDPGPTPALSALNDEEVATHLVRCVLWGGPRQEVSRLVGGLPCWWVVAAPGRLFGGLMGSRPVAQP